MQPTESDLSWGENEQQYNIASPGPNARDEQGRETAVDWIDGTGPRVTGETACACGQAAGLRLETHLTRGGATCDTHANEFPAVAAAVVAEVLRLRTKTFPSDDLTALFFLPTEKAFDFRTRDPSYSLPLPRSSHATSSLSGSVMAEHVKASPRDGASNCKPHLGC